MLPRYISCYDWKGRYRLLRTLLKSTEHTGVCGLLIGKVKDYVHETLEVNHRDVCFPFFLWLNNTISFNILDIRLVWWDTELRIISSPGIRTWCMYRVSETSYSVSHQN